MQTRPIESYRRRSSANPHKHSHIRPNNDYQHGFPPPLLNLPQESLIHVTSYLSPPSLFALARTCRRLCEHVDDDNTWLRAFLTQYLGISPEHELQSQRMLLLKRTESTWRKEFILRYVTMQRWERSRNPTVTHAPQDSSIDGAHLMSEYGLLTSSTQYGTVARSIPFNGRVLKGYIDASGTGMRIGNPNVEFAPDVSVCAMTSDGGTARVFWGKRNGEVALTVANRVMDSRATSRFIQCRVDEQHEGPVQHLVPDSDSNTLLSAGADGRIKLWDSKMLQLLWSTGQQKMSLVTDPFISIAGGLSSGFVAGALKSGDIILYELHDLETCTDGPRVLSDHQIRISSLTNRDRPQLTNRNDVLPEQQIAKMWLYCTGQATVSLFVQYTNHSQFYRVHANIQTRDLAITPFGDDSFGNVSVVEPIISPYSLDCDMVIVGDLLGFVSIYDADAPPQTTVPPVHRFEAHTDGAVTSISWSPIVFATGSARGTTVVRDSLTLEPVRYFTSPSPRPSPGQDWHVVSQISVDKELVVIIVRNRVMTWKVGSASSRGYHQKKPRHANTKTSITSKGHEQHEMHKDITESYRELEYERAHAQRVYGREREQRSTLDTLGLSELEAVEYVLMLSREEEEERQQRLDIDEGVFEGEFDDAPSTPTSSRVRPVRSVPSTPLSLRDSPTSHHHQSVRQYPRITLPTSNEKVQVSPPFVPEPMEAGTSISPLGSLTISSTQPSPIIMRSVSSSLDDFPAISSSLSSTSSRRGRPASPDQLRSAWDSPLKSMSPTPGSSSPSAIAPVIARSRSSNMSLLSVDIARHSEAAQAVEEIDDDLRFAIELSLTETQSKGELGV